VILVFTILSFPFAGGGRPPSQVLGEGARPAAPPPSCASDLVLAFSNCGLPFLCFQYKEFRSDFDNFDFNGNLNEILNISGTIDSTKKREGHILEMSGIGECMVYVSRIIYVKVG